MESVVWNPWHGCKKYSEGCANCYVYRRDESIGKDASIVYRTGSFDLPLRKNSKGEYKIKPQTHVYCCMTSDFFLDEADVYRTYAWEIIRERKDLFFTIITKRIERAAQCLPADWQDGWDNVEICSTMENQRQFDLRMPIFIDFPARHKALICEPLLTPVDFHGLLQGNVTSVTVGGESGDKARECNYDWVLDIRSQCIQQHVRFHFKQTGANFVKAGRHYHIERYNQMSQAAKANIDYDPEL